jgi:hypothetical protein
LCSAQHLLLFMLVERPRKEITFCKFFSEGGCAFGDTCKFPHSMIAFCRHFIFIQLHYCSSLVDDTTGKETRGENWTPSKRAEPLPSSDTEAMEPISLLVERVPPGTQESDLLFLFHQYGPVQDVRLDTRYEPFDPRLSYI